MIYLSIILGLFLFLMNKLDENLLEFDLFLLAFVFSLT